jgi:hypothetical protein
MTHAVAQFWQLWFLLWSCLWILGENSGVTTWMAAGRMILRVQCRAGSGPAHYRHCQANPCQAGRGGGAKEAKDAKSKYNCAWTWVCLVWTSGSGRFAAFRRASRAGAAGNKLIGQIKNMYIQEYTMIYRPQTSIYIVHDGIYLYILSWNIIYRHIPS